MVWVSGVGFVCSSCDGTGHRGQHGLMPTLVEDLDAVVERLDAMYKRSSYGELRLALADLRQLRVRLVAFEYLEQAQKIEDAGGRV